jgi:hypothetical protein
VTDRERTARLMGVEREPQLPNFAEIEQAVEQGFEDFHFAQSRTLYRLLPRLFFKPDIRALAEQAILTALEEASDVDRSGIDIAVHFSTGTSYCLQVKDWREALKTPLRPLPPSERAKQRLERVRHDVLYRPSRLPKYPLLRGGPKSEEGSHLAISMGESGRVQGVLKVADRSGANEIYRRVSSDPNNVTDDTARGRLHSLAIVSDVDPDRGSTGPIALIEPMFRRGFLTHSTKFLCDLEVDSRKTLDGTSGQSNDHE